MLRNWIFGDLAGFGIESAKKLLAEARIPSDAVGIDHHIVRLNGLARQVVFRNDDARAAAFRTRPLILTSKRMTGLGPS